MQRDGGGALVTDMIYALCSKKTKTLQSFLFIQMWAAQQSPLYLQRPLQQRGDVAVMAGGHVKIGPGAAAPVEIRGHPIYCQSCDRVILMGQRELVHTLTLKSTKTLNCIFMEYKGSS